MNNTLSLITFSSSISDNNLVIELLRTLPAWIALIISLTVPFITKKLEIEKAYKQFIFQEKYKIYSEHFSMLHYFNNTIKNFLVILNKALSEGATIEEIIQAKTNLYSSWEDIKKCEAKLWIIAPEHILALRAELLLKMRNLNSKISSLGNQNSLAFDNKDLSNLITLSTELQTPFSQYLEYYRKEIEKVFK